MFEALIQNIEATIASRIFRVHLQQQPDVIVPMTQMVEEKQAVFGDLTKEVEEEEVKPAKTAPSSTKGNISDLAAAFAKAKATPKAAPGSAQIKIGRNDPCPCGAINPATGKVFKYKQCGLINAPWHGK